MSVWHSLAYSTYKFVGMIICLVMFLAGGKTFYYCALAYTAAALSFFLVRMYRIDTYFYSFPVTDCQKLRLRLKPLQWGWRTEEETHPDSVHPLLPTSNHVVANKVRFSHLETYLQGVTAIVLNMLASILDQQEI